jgi:hypothetical protein
MRSRYDSTFVRFVNERVVVAQRNVLVLNGRVRRDTRPAVVNGPLRYVLRYSRELNLYTLVKGDAPRDDPVEKSYRRLIDVFD